MEFDEQKSLISAVELLYNTSCLFFEKRTKGQAGWMAPDERKQPNDSLAARGLCKSESE
jgi:hypothetical protein